MRRRASARRLERELRMRLIAHELIDDDSVVERTFKVHKIIDGRPAAPLTWTWTGAFLLGRKPSGIGEEGALPSARRWKSRRIFASCACPGSSIEKIRPCATWTKSARCWATFWSEAGGRDRYRFTSCTFTPDFAGLRPCSTTCTTSRNWRIKSSNSLRTDTTRSWIRPGAKPVQPERRRHLPGTGGFGNTDRAAGARI